MLSKSMDSSYEPLILKKMKTSREQFGVEQSSLHADGVMPMDSEPAEPRLSPTNTAEKCRRILTRTSENSCVLFEGKRDNPSEKSKMLHTTPDKSSLRFVGEKENPLERTKILIRTPDENPLQVAAQSGIPSEKSKFCFSSPLPCFQATQCTKQVRAADQPFNIQDYCKDILKKTKDSESGESFLGLKSVFSFL
uniref:Uncharacterized protein n=1 Tax=Arundo donax TaxID=35708 RepID=A0A0A9BSM7_ARUDO